MFGLYLALIFWTIFGFFNFLDYIWIWILNFLNFLDYGWIWTEFKKFRTGSGSQNVTVRSSLAIGTVREMWSE